MGSDVAEQNHMAVRCCLCNILAGDRAVRACFILDDNWLAQSLTKTLRDQSCHGVVRAPRGSWHHNCDLLGWKTLALHGARQDR